jgi:hypothetical protein
MHKGPAARFNERHRTEIVAGYLFFVQADSSKAVAPFH